MPSSSHTLDRLTVTFDDAHAVADAGLVLSATLLEHLNMEATADAVVSRGYRAGRKIATVVSGLLAGADCIDDLSVLRAGATGRALPARVMAPSMIGTSLRSVTFGHVRQLDRLTGLLLTRAWAAGAGPGSNDLVIDIDSTVCEVHGYAKQGAAYGYTHTLAITRCWRPAPTPARSCTRGCGKDPRTRPAARRGSCVRPSGGSAAPARLAG
jgi:hypothetical protein